MGFYEDMEKSLLEAIDMEKGDIPVVQRENMPAPTFFVADKEKELIEAVVELRKEQDMSQSELAQLLGIKQQALSRIENQKHSPSLKLFYSIVEALGYKIEIVKR